MRPTTLMPEFVLLQHEHLTAGSRKSTSRGRAHRPGSDHDDVVGAHGSFLPDSRKLSEASGTMSNMISIQPAERSRAASAAAALSPRGNPQSVVHVPGRG